MRIAFTITFFVACIFSLHGQNTIGIPDIINYPKSVYNAGTSNWDIVQDRNGIVYFANSEGLLSFDGAYWKTYHFPNRTMGRSIAIGADNRIYAGTQDDFGYFSPDTNGQLVFYSLKPLLSEKNRSLTSVWDIICQGHDVFFRCESKIFRYNNGLVSVYPASSQWLFLGNHNKELIAQDQRNGLLKFTNGVWSPFLKENVLPDNYVVTDMVPFGKDSTLIATRKNGLFVLAGEKVTTFNITGIDPLVNELVLSCTPVNHDRIAVGTQLNGCYIIDRHGEVIQNFSRTEGLQNNCVTSLYLDRNRNLWLGLDNGIDFTAYNNGIKHIYPENLNEGAGYTSIIHNSELYVGTSNRLYRLPMNSMASDLSFQKGNFEPVDDTRGSSWGLFEVNGKLLMSHHEGGFEVKNGTAVPLSRGGGHWTFLPYYNVLPSSVMVAGRYGGLDFYNYGNNSFSYKASVPGFNDAARFAAVDNNNTIWIAHTVKGVYRVMMDGDKVLSVKLFTTKEGLPLPTGYRLFKAKSRIVIATEKGVYEYNEKKDRFELSEYFKPFFNERNIRYIREDASGNIWFVEDKMPGVVDLSGPQPRTIHFTELNDKITNGFEHINPVNSSNIIVGAEKGFYHINYDQYLRNSYQAVAKIRLVRAEGRTDSLLFGGYFAEINDTLGQDSRNIPKVANKWNSFHFEYSSPLNENPNSVQYSYLLKGLDDNWSSWSRKTEKEYTNLPAGNYTFQVKARNNLGNESPISSFSFTVLPPWYQTVWAYALYGAVVLAIVYLLYHRQKRKFLAQQKKYEEEQKRLQYLHQLELDKSEKEIMALKNEKLQAQIEHKNTELASVAMHLVQKGELLTKIKEELTRIRNAGGTTTNSNGNGAIILADHNTEEFKKIMRILKEEDKMDKDWEHFAVHFDNVHSDFLKDMKERYPNLSAHELKLCAYLRMNLSSKEIAQLMNISVRGVEISRYRLRKKLGIPTEMNLFDFLMKFSPQKSA
jgi:DNA-binding CsgD family transcriptional regulator